MKYCPACKLTLADSAFYKDGCRRDGLASKCKECDRAYRRLRVQADPELLRKYNLQCQFKLDWSDYLLVLAVQERRCAVCRVPFAVTPAVDHDRSCCPGHKSCGQCIRGLLCFGCNAAAGLMRDDVATIRRLAEYING